MKTLGMAMIFSMKREKDISGSKALQIEVNIFDIDQSTIESH